MRKSPFAGIKMCRIRCGGLVRVVHCLYHLPAQWVRGGGVWTSFGRYLGRQSPGLRYPGLEAGSRTEKFLLIAMPVVLVLLLIIPARRCGSILGGSVGYSEYGLVRHMPFVETYMHENGMLDGYYENVIDGSLSTPDEIAWAQERLAD